MTSIDDHEAYGDILHNLTVDSTYILKLLQSLDISKGPGSDAIPPMFFVKCAKSIASPIAYIFNRCFREGYFPVIWKTAHIVPIHKKGSRASIENYRPISILNVLGKLMEKIVHVFIYPTISKNIPQEQHGFIKSRSTNTNLAVFTEDVIRDMDGGGQVDVVYTDFEKAFDRVDHVILLRKLQELGIRGDLLRWFDSYLKNRSQIVTVGGSKSNSVTIPSGVPQGSILGPLLYSIYLYDIGRYILNAKFLMYADDTKIYMKIQNNLDCDKLQCDLNRLSKYYDTNRLNVNVDKCLVVTFTRKRKAIHYNYGFGNVEIGRGDLVRDLGVLLDSKLLFSEHISYIVDKAYKNLGFVIRSCQQFTDMIVLKTVYYAYIRSILEYCSNIWNPSYITYTQQIELIQSKFLKHLNYRDRFNIRDYYMSCKRHNMLPLEARRTILDMIFLHKVCNGAIDCSDLNNSVLKFRAPSRRTRHTQLFDVPHSNTNYAQNSIISRIKRCYMSKFSDLDIFNTKITTYKEQLFATIREELINIPFSTLK